MRMLGLGAAGEVTMGFCLERGQALGFVISPSIDPSSYTMIILFSDISLGFVGV